MPARPKCSGRGKIKIKIKSPFNVGFARAWSKIAKERDHRSALRIIENQNQNLHCQLILPQPVSLSLSLLFIFAPPNAEVVKLVDTHVSGACAREGVRVRVPPSAPF